MTDIGEWFQNLPIFTRYWLGLTCFFSLLGRFHIIDPMNFLLTYYGVFNKFQIWRLVTSLFYYPINGNTGIHFLFNCYFLYNYSLNLETSTYAGRPADYAFLLLFNWICILVSAFIFKFYILMDCAVMAVLYIWSQLNKEVIVNFWFGTRFKAMYLPWILFGFNLVINGIGMMDLIGIVIGHLFFFLSYQYPNDFGGPTLISTPSFLYQLFPNERVTSQFGQAPQRRPNLDGDTQRRTGGHNWGQGHVLGGR
ncbi:UNVERIFIED_CONTAM: hypothetical protein PYX00_004635 [Menopon gallinae]|uniref:Derlin n=1 Tax=Menopon gallinae TaxID=328185 RepID=A0AAW2I4I0_9NEOP